jgi:hypothetical protein
MVRMSESLRGRRNVLYIAVQVAPQSARMCGRERESSDQIALRCIRAILMAGTSLMAGS